jgi:hypothetical protein
MTPQQRPDDLAPWLQAARTDLAGRVPPPWLGAQLESRAQEQLALHLARRHASARPQRPRPAWRWLVWGAGASAAAALAVAIVVALPALQAPRAAPGPRFVALAPIEDIVAERGALLVPAQVPRAQLADYGLPVDPARADQPARAEFVLSPRGVVLAVRFVE